MIEARLANSSSLICGGKYWGVYLVTCINDEWTQVSILYRPDLDAVAEVWIGEKRRRAVRKQAHFRSVFMRAWVADKLGVQPTYEIDL